MLLTLVAAAVAAPAAEVLRCLELSDLACAQEAAAQLGRAPADLAARAELAFSLGEFAEARELDTALGGGGSVSPEQARRSGLYELTAEATADFATVRRGDVTLRYRPGMDEVLVDEALETLQAAHDRIAPLLGGAPPGGVRMELYPTAQRFIDASSLPAAAVRNTGVIALSKWTRLLVSSPRALGHGYAWKDTIAHEYIHYVVAWRSLDKTPVWLQEGIARSHESLWNLDAPPPLAPLHQSLLADALANDTLVPLARMHPSMAFLDSGEQASLAFAQVSTMVQYLRQVAGNDAVSRVLDLVRDDRDALQAVADVGAAGDVAAFMAGWRAYLGGMDLVKKKLAAAPTLLDGPNDEIAADPVLGRRTDLAKYARLGDILFDAGRPDAALVEYGKAQDPGTGPSPVLSARTAEALLATGRAAEARAALEASIADYPEYAVTRAALAKLLLAQGNVTGALVHYRAAADVDPFDPETQGALADLFAATGNPSRAERHARYQRILQSAEAAAPSR